MTDSMLNPAAREIPRPRSCPSPSRAWTVKGCRRARIIGNDEHRTTRIEQKRLAEIREKRSDCTGRSEIRSRNQMSVNVIRDAQHARERVSGDAHPIDLDRIQIQLEFGSARTSDDFSSRIGVDGVGATDRRSIGEDDPHSASR